MNYLLPLLIVGVIMLLVLITVAMSRHKKSGTHTLKVIGAAGLVDTKLDPIGTVLIDGELWPAQSRDAAILNSKTKVRVIALHDHLLLVEPLLSDKL